MVVGLPKIVFEETGMLTGEKCSFELLVLKPIARRRSRAVLLRGVRIPCVCLVFWLVTAPG
jgi:hypothetical protein